MITYGSFRGGETPVERQSRRIREAIAELRTIVKLNESGRATWADVVTSARNVVLAHEQNVQEATK